MISVPCVTQICFHLGCIGPAGERLRIREALGKSEVETLKTSIASRKHSVCRDLQVGIAAGLVAGKDLPVCAGNIYFIRVIEHAALIGNIIIVRDEQIHPVRLINHITGKR